MALVNDSNSKITLHTPKTLKDFFFIFLLFIQIVVPLIPIPAENKVPSFELFMGRKLYSEKRYKEALRFLTMAREKRETSPEDLILLGICYIKLKKIEKAEEILNEATKLHPNPFALNIALGSLHFEKREFQVSYTYFERARKLQPHSEQALQGMIASLINSGVEEYAKGNKDGAKHFFEKALALKPDSVEALRNLGIVYEKEGNIKKAIDLFSRALKIRPEDPVLLRLLAEALKKTGDRRRLVRILKRLSTILPTSPYPFENLGLLYEEEGKSKDALMAFENAIRRGSEQPYPYYRVAEDLFNRGDIEKSISTLYLAIGNAVHKISSLQLKAAGRIRKKGGKLNKSDIEALKLYSSLIKKPKNVLLDSINLLRKLDGNNKRFEADIRKLSQWYPHSIELKEALAGVLEKEGKLDEAYTTWLKILEKNPTNANAHKHMARILYKQGKTKKAILEYRRALDLNPKDQSVYKNLIEIYKREKKEERLLQILKSKYLTQRRNVILIESIIRILNDLGKKQEAKVFKEKLKKLTEDQ